MDVNVDIEYCGKCNFKSQCAELSTFIKTIEPEVKIVCHEGRRGSFEVKINDILVHSKLESLAFPENDAVSDNVRNATKGLPLIKCKEQPITDCVIQ